MSYRHWSLPRRIKVCMVRFDWGWGGWPRARLWQGSAAAQSPADAWPRPAWARTVGGDHGGPRILTSGSGWNWKLTSWYNLWNIKVLSWQKNHFGAVLSKNNGTLHQGERGRNDIYARVTWSILDPEWQYWFYGPNAKHEGINVNMPDLTTM